MRQSETINFREALNTISDVVQNRPSPLREFDQIYMKVGDLVIQADYIARAFDKLDVVFIGDGDSISLSVMHLKNKKVFPYGPRRIQVLDFDERIVNAINHFARNNGLEDKIAAQIYNVCNPIPHENSRVSEAFYTNPPWGASNDGQSVTAFIRRGIEACKPKSIGAIVIADDVELEWTGKVLYRTQEMLLNSGFIVTEMIPGLHKYHLDDAPELTSCCILVRDIDSAPGFAQSNALSELELANFYGRNNPLRAQYVKDLSGLNQGKASDTTYKIIPIQTNI